jgi:hypothetical protein
MSLIPRGLLLLIVLCISYCANGYSLFNFTCIWPYEQTPEITYSYAWGPGLYGGVSNSPATIFIQLVDGFGNNVTKGGDSVSATIYGPNQDTKTWVIMDNLDGTYTISYLPDDAGVYQIWLSVNGSNFWGTPFIASFVQSSQCPVQHTNELGKALGTYGESQITNDDCSSRVFLTCLIILIYPSRGRHCPHAYGMKTILAAIPKMP